MLGLIGMDSLYKVTFILGIQKFTIVPSQDSVGTPLDGLVLLVSLGFYLGRLVGVFKQPLTYLVRLVVFFK